MTAAGLLNVFEWLADEVAHDVQLQTLRVFLFVATRGECTQKDVEQGLNMTGASVSRNISYWTTRRFDKAQGMGFIERSEDDEDRRLKKLILSRSGQAFYNKLKGKI